MLLVENQKVYLYLNFVHYMVLAYLKFWIQNRNTIQ